MWILCLVEDSLEMSSLIFSEKQWKKYLWMSSAAAVIGTLKVNVKLNLLYKDYIVWTVKSMQVKEFCCCTNVVTKNVDCICFNP